MNVKKYWKAIAAAVGTAIGTGLVVAFNGDAGQIDAISAAVVGLTGTIAVIISPKNAE